MKSAQINPAPAVCASLALASLVSAQTIEPAQKRTALVKERHVPFSTLLGQPYSSTFGLSLWESDGAELEEVIFRPWKDADPKTKGLEGRLHKIALDELTKSGTVHTDFGKRGGNRQLGFKDNTGSALLFRLRDQFQYLNEDSNEAKFNYTSDRDTGEGFAFKGAAMLDIYEDHLYNKSITRTNLWVDNPYRMWVRVGAEWNYNDQPGAAQADTRRFYGLLNFAANPDQSAEFLAIPGANITSPQFIQLGAVYEQNAISGEDDVRWIIGWQPRFLMDYGAEPMASVEKKEAKKDGSHGLFRGFGLNKRMYYRKGGHLDIWTQDDGDENRSSYYTFINPEINVEGASAARVTKALKGIKSVKGAQSALDDLQKEVITYNVKAGIGFWDGRVELSGALHGVHPIANLGESHTWTEVRADFRLFQDEFVPDYNPETAPKKTWAGATAYISWTRGEAEPTFKDVDTLMVGVGLRF